MTRDQAIEALMYFDDLQAGATSRFLMVGVMMSYKTLHSLPTKWATAFPAKERVADIFVPHARALNSLHYADYTNTEVITSLTQAIFYGGQHIDALQLDMVWPEPSDITQALRLGDKVLLVILQVGKNAMEQAGNSPERVIERLRRYDGVIDGVLFDKSMGQGQPMNPEVLLPYVEATYRHLPDLRVAVAGGLGPSTVDIAEPIISRFPDVSIDAQERLRPSGNALDPIDWGLAKDYLRVATNLFAKHSS